MPPTAIPTRQLNCARCGVAFECGLAGDCWCAAEPYRLPMPKPATEEKEAKVDCLCPACLRQAAKDIHA
jgi:hypothetical protein